MGSGKEPAEVLRLGLGPAALSRLLDGNAELQLYITDEAVRMFVAKSGSAISAAIHPKMEEARTFAANLIEDLLIRKPYTATTCSPIMIDRVKALVSDIIVD